MGRPGGAQHAPTLAQHVKPRNFVVRIGNKQRTCGEHAHVQPVNVVGMIRLVSSALLFGQVLHALANQAFCFGVQLQRYADGFGRTLAGVVVGRSAYAAGAKDDVTAVKRTF